MAGQLLSNGMSPATSTATAVAAAGRYSFPVPEDANDIETLLDLGESAASFSRRATAANRVPGKG